MNSNHFPTTLDFVFQDLNDKVDALYRHGALQADYSSRIRNYGDDCYMSEVEAHTLAYVCDHVDTTVTQLAKYSYRTKGAVSKMLKKLEEKGLILREQKGGNKKWVYFSPTERGKKANQLHRAYDRLKTMEMLQELSKYCTLEEIESFYKVTALRIKIMEQKEYADCGDE